MSSRTPLIPGNWKMYHGGASGCDLASEIALGVGNSSAQVVVAPPFTALAAVAASLHGSRVEVSAQNLHEKAEGAYTGEVSAAMIKDAGADYVIIGHSERRRLFGETDKTVNRRLISAIGAGLTPIVCVGETLEEREANQTLAVLDRQINDGLDALSAQQVADLVVAYEPVWAIGTGKVATAAQAQEAHAHIRGRLRQWFGGDAADHCHVIYGGSVKPDNIGELIRQPDVDGALVGGASLDVKGFADIVLRSRPA